MDEELIRKLVKWKLDATDKLIDRLPARLSIEIKQFGRIFLESMTERAQEKNEQPANQLNHIQIE